MQSGLQAHASLFTLKPPPPAAWFEYAKQYHPDVTLEYVETTCKYTADKASLLQQVFGPGT